MLGFVACHHWNGISFNVDPNKGRIGQHIDQQTGGSIGPVT